MRHRIDCGTSVSFLKYMTIIIAAVCLIVGFTLGVLTVKTTERVVNVYHTHETKKAEIINIDEYDTNEWKGGN